MKFLRIVPHVRVISYNNSHHDPAHVLQILHLSPALSRKGLRIHTKILSDIITYISCELHSHSSTYQGCFRRYIVFGRLDELIANSFE